MNPEYDVRRLYLLVSLVVGIALPLQGQATGVIRGSVRLPSDSAAPGSQVSLRGTQHRAVAGASGRFLLTGVPVGAHVLVAALEGHNPGSATVTVAAGDTTSVVITLGKPVQLEEIRVTAAPIPVYAVDTTSVVLRMPVAIRDIPQTITAVSQAAISDRNIVELRRVGENVSSVVPQVGYDGFGLNEQSYIIRGMTSDYTSTGLRDGFKDFAGVSPRDVASIERVEFLKGPNSVLFGSTGALGGLPNTVTKQPRATSIADASMMVNNFGLLRGTLDLGGPLNHDATIRYRFNGSLEQSRNYRPFEEGSYGFSLAPVIQFLPGPGTSIILRGEYTQRRFRSDPYLPLDPVAFDLPIHNYYGEPDTPLGDAYGFVGQMVFTHRFSPALSFRQGLSAIGGSMDHNSVSLYGLSAPDSVIRGYSSTQEWSRDYASQTELVISGRTGGLRHQALVGLELSREIYSVDFTIDDLAPIGLLDPQYGATPVGGPLIQAKHPENQLALYAQDLVSIGSHVKAMIGARLDVNKTDQYVGEDVVATQTTDHVSPRAGLVYQPTDALSFYGGWSTSFLPNLSCLACGDPATFPPESGVQFEIGVRQQFAGGRFAINAAVYQITKSNVLEGIPGDTLGRSFLSLQQRSTGAELDVQGTPLPGWRLVLTYAYTNARQTEGVDITDVRDERLAHVPTQAASLWSAYSFESGALRGLTAGGGLFLSSEREATFPNTFELPGYVRLDLMAAYVWKRWELQLNLDNVTDTRYYDSVTSFTLGLAPFAPRSLVVSLSKRL